jgi:hypothetical protein
VDGYVPTPPNWISFLSPFFPSHFCHGVAPKKAATFENSDQESSKQVKRMNRAFMGNLSIAAGRSSTATIESFRIFSYLGIRGEAEQDLSVPLETCSPLGVLKVEGLTAVQLKRVRIFSREALSEPPCSVLSKSIELTFQS